MSRLTQRELKTLYSGLNLFSFLLASVWPLGEFPLSYIFFWTNQSTNIKHCSTPASPSPCHPRLLLNLFPVSGIFPSKLSCLSNSSLSEVSPVSSFLFITTPVYCSWYLCIYLWQFLFHFVTVMKWNIVNSLMADIKNGERNLKILDIFEI